MNKGRSSKVCQEKIDLLTQFVRLSHDQCQGGRVPGKVDKICASNHFRGSRHGSTQELHFHACWEGHLCCGSSGAYLVKLEIPAELAKREAEVLIYKNYCPRFLSLSLSLSLSPSLPVSLSLSLSLARSLLDFQWPPANQIDYKACLKHT